MKRNLFTLLLLAAFVFQSTALAQAPAVTITAADRKAAEAVTAAQLSDYLHFVASDEMEGRDTPSRGLDITAKFIGMNLSRWGFKPAGDNGTFYQKMALRSESTDPANNTLKVGDTNFTYLDDFIRFSGNSAVNAPLIFARDGWMIKSKGIDAYQGVSVKDKTVVVYGQGFPNRQHATSPPAGVMPNDLSGAQGTDWADPLTYARQSGAKAMIVVASPQIQGAWAQVRAFMSRGGLSPEKLREAKPEGDDFPVILVSSKVGDAIFAGESGGRDSAVSYAIGKPAELKVAAKTETKWTQNVVAIWEGSDPVLKNEMVAIGAHYDHVGVNPNAPGDDKIYNGADDDGSGTVAVLAIAEALAKTNTRPKRSILFVWHCGEEKGLWGSEYFNKFPTVDIKQVIAQLNIDMIGRSLDPKNVILCDTPRKLCNEDLSEANEIYVIGSEMMSSTLGAVTREANAAYLKMDYNYKYDDPNDKERFFFRSDHFHYAVNGIPVVFWFSGTHEDYHQASDHVDKIDFAKMELVARTIMVTMLKLADLNERPKVDKQLPPELTKR